MIPEDPNPSDLPPTLNESQDTRSAELHDEPSAPIHPARTHRLRIAKIAGLIGFLFLIFAIVAFLLERHHVGTQMRANLPQLDGSLVVYGLSAPVTVQRDAQGVPHIHASSMDDLVFAQGYITAQDRLWQMDILRRHAAGQLAEIIGRSALEADRLQRTLQLRATADRAVAILPPDQKRWLAIYANGVNASIAAQHDHLPIEFRTLGYAPAPWTPRDSILVELAIFQDLTNTYSQKLGREALTAQLPPDLVTDLYPTTSWRDHPPGQPIPDVTTPQPDIPDIPLDESQSRLVAPHLTRSFSAADLLLLQQALGHPPCDTCIAGSNGWAVAGSRTASGKPMLSNDMHLQLTLPGTWYEADLQADLPSPLTAFHAAGVTLPGIPFVIAGHNQHVAWGFTNLGADVQDLYIEHTRGTPTGAEYQTPGGAWRPVRYQNEVIHIRGSANINLSVPLTRHGDIETPIISSIYPGERRTVSLLWSVYDPATLSDNFFAVDSATDWTSMLAAFSNSIGLPLNLMYADDQGHIGYHAVGRVPIRGDINNPSPLSPVPTDATAPDAATHEWAGYIPFDQLPQAFDPPDGILATANSRVTPDGYRYPITLNWLAPYRTERIYKVLEASPQQASDDNEPGKVAAPVPTGSEIANGAAVGNHLLTPADMLALQNDVFSELDQVFAQRLAYAIDNTTGPLKNNPVLHQAADLLRQWNGEVDANEAAPAIVNSARNAFWPMLLIPKLAPSLAPKIAAGVDLSKVKNLSPNEARATFLWQFYIWGNRGSVEEELLTHTPARWLPAGFANWDDFLAAVVQRGLRDAKAPTNLSTWQEGKQYPVDIEHPLFARSIWIKRLIGLPVGTGPQSHSGDGTTVKMISDGFGPSERFTADLSDPDRTTLDLVLGQSGNPASSYFMDQFPDWLRGTTYPLPFSAPGIQSATIHTLTLNPR